jgi:hypothetical protein
MTASLLHSSKLEEELSEKQPQISPTVACGSGGIEGIERAPSSGYDGPFHNRHNRQDLPASYQAVTAVTAMSNAFRSADFHRTARRFAERLAELAAVTIDAGVYDRVRAFRAANCRHPKTGLHKRRLTLDELAGIAGSAAGSSAGASGTTREGHHRERAPHRFLRSIKPHLGKAG